jgi:hypothetical protein
MQKLIVTTLVLLSVGMCQAQAKKVKDPAPKTNTPAPPVQTPPQAPRPIPVPDNLKGKKPVVDSPRKKRWHDPGSMGIEKEIRLARTKEDSLRQVSDTTSQPIKKH